MIRYAPTAAAMAAPLLILLPSVAAAQSEMPPELQEAARRPGGDAVLRRAREEDRRQVARLNRAQASATADRDRAIVRSRDAANDRAQERYRAEMAAWRRRVDACRGGEWSQCDR
ncbi:MAG: hypothetical protein QM690_13950 [Sphingobium sp.]